MHNCHDNFGTIVFSLQKHIADLDQNCPIAVLKESQYIFKETSKDIISGLN